MSLFRRRLMMQWIEDDRYIHFAAPEMERLCVSKFVTNGQRRLSKNRAAELTDSDVSGLIKSSSTVKSFDEFKYFTGVRILSDFINKNEWIESVTLPRTLKKVEAYGISFNNRLSIRIESEDLTIYRSSFVYVNRCDLGAHARIANDSVYLIGARQYRIEDGNPYYAMDGEFVYTKDFSTLVAIPSGYAERKMTFRKGTTKLSPGPAFFNAFVGEEIIVPDTVKILPGYLLYGHETVKRIVFGSGVENYGVYMCNRRSALETIVFKRKTPPIYAPAIHNELFRTGDTPQNLREIFVPDESVQLYKAKFTNVAGLIKPLSTYTGDLQ